MQSAVYTRLHSYLQAIDTGDVVHATVQRRWPGMETPQRLERGNCLLLRGHPQRVREIESLGYD